MALVVALGLVAACSALDRDGSSDADWSVADARAFDEYALWWLGEAYNGERLASILAVETQDDESSGIGSVAFLYGSCTPTSDGGCPSPYQVIVEPNCVLPVVGEVILRGFRGEGELGEFPDGHFRIATGSVAITLFAPTRDEALRMAEDIQPLNAVAPDGPLAAPQSGCDLPPASD